MGWKSFPEDIREGGYRRPDESQAKANVDATPIEPVGAAKGQPVAQANGPDGAELAGRLDARRSASATSEIMDATAGETAPTSKRERPSEEAEAADAWQAHIYGED